MAKKDNKNDGWVVGIDEVGRGPLAGPVGVGVVLVKTDFAWEKFLPNVRDSKKLTVKKREMIFTEAEDLKKAKLIFFAVELVSAQIIDEKGIIFSINKALSQALNKVLENLHESERGKIEIKLDGGLKAPVEFKNQKSFIKGDDKEKVIGLASILAKVTRDRYMEEVAKKSDFSVYFFEKHKGYGTKKHRELIKNHGFSTEHRKSFCRNIEVL